MSLVCVLFILVVSFQGHLMSIWGVVPTYKLDPVLGEQRAPNPSLEVIFNIMSSQKYEQDKNKFI